MSTTAPVRPSLRQPGYSRLTGSLCLLIWLFWMLGPFSSAVAQTNGEQLDEYQLKAIYIQHLPAFVTWPETHREGPFIIGVLGDTPIYQHLVTNLASHKIDERPVEIRKWTAIDQIEPVHLLVVSEEFRRWTSQALNSVKDQPTLTVGDYSDFAQRGGIVAFRVFQDRIGLIINRRAANEANLALSAKLLAVATTVIED